MGLFFSLIGLAIKGFRCFVPSKWPREFFLDGVRFKCKEIMRVNAVGENRLAFHLIDIKQPRYSEVPNSGRSAVLAYDNRIVVIENFDLLVCFALLDSKTYSRHLMGEDALGILAAQQNGSTSEIKDRENQSELV